MMAHTQARELIPLFALDALEGRERDEVRSHLDSCPVCRSELSRYMSVTAALTPDSGAPRQTWDRIVASIQQTG